MPLKRALKESTMKINECTLAAFATSHYDAPPDKEGWLWKKGEVNKVFH